MARAPPPAPPHGQRRDPGSTRGFPELLPGTPSGRAITSRDDLRGSSGNQWKREEAYHAGLLGSQSMKPSVEPMRELSATGWRLRGGGRNTKGSVVKPRVEARLWSPGPGGSVLLPSCLPPTQDLKPRPSTSWQPPEPRPLPSSPARYAAAHPPLRRCRSVPNRPRGAAAAGVCPRHAHRHAVGPPSRSSFGLLYNTIEG